MQKTVSPETAILLKAIGFPQNTERYYVPSGPNGKLKLWNAEHYSAVDSEHGACQTALEAGGIAAPDAHELSDALNKYTTPSPEDLARAYALISPARSALDTLTGTGNA